MGKRRTYKRKESIVQCNCNNISEERMIEIQAEAYYRALKKIEQEKLDTTKPEKTKPEKTKRKDELLFILNVVFFPWKINKRFNVNNQIYDGILVIVVSCALQLIGMFAWLLGIGIIVMNCFQVREVGLSSLLIESATGILTAFLGSMFVVSGKEFSKEIDSDKIYAYSGSIIALVSCVVGIIALLKMNGG